jgi:hypothetical protein
MSKFGSCVFGKSLACPSSEILLCYVEESLSFLLSYNVELHLGSCDFCSAELQLLSRHPPIAEHEAPAEVPILVRLLAEKQLPRTLSANSARQAA